MKDAQWDICEILLVIESDVGQIYLPQNMSNLSPFGGGKNPPWVRNAGHFIKFINAPIIFSHKACCNNYKIG